MYYSEAIKALYQIWLAVVNGLNKLIDSLSAGLDICLEHVVEEIRYDDNKVSVTCSVKGQQKAVFVAECVLSTLPLGVLKRSVKNKSRAPLFIPPLPVSKVDAIDAVGFGNVNKVILVFEKAFWGSTHAFGHAVNPLIDTGFRGEYFMFQAHENVPVLTVLVSGMAAEFVENTPAQKYISKIMAFLKAVFGEECPAQPKDIIITRWRSDCFSQGSYSYIPPGCSPVLYDTLSAPVKDSSGFDRIFFAGEHTCREQPASLHGAYMSGLREAGHIANRLIGIPYSSNLTNSDGTSDVCI
ncbi:unnamed protein product [Thelazia callipaeda]|uniref:Amino_oxidase domain-containing protein n=1 Tax=Thelazia callipaeda TaxID=103827 RepID=A0A0N5CW89_THECL|nr:unnamed protein product [Thelazia callipaeda]